MMACYQVIMDCAKINAQQFKIQIDFKGGKFGMSVAAPTATRVESRATPLLLDRLAVVVSGAALVLAVLGVIYALVLAVWWNSLAFPGFLTSSQLVISSIRPIKKGYCSGLRAALRSNERML